MPLAQILERFDVLRARHGWVTETVYAYPDAADLQIKAWRTPPEGRGLWVLSGIHGEEPAGPNAIAQELESLVEFARTGVPVVVLPLCNPRAYRHNWRYPNTPSATGARAAATASATPSTCCRTSRQARRRVRRGPQAPRRSR